MRRSSMWFLNSPRCFSIDRYGVLLLKLQRLPNALIYPGAHLVHRDDNPPPGAHTGEAQFVDPLPESRLPHADQRRRFC